MESGQKRAPVFSRSLSDAGRVVESRYRWSLAAGLDFDRRLQTLTAVMYGALRRLG